MDKTKLGSGILIVAVLVLVVIAGVWYWSQPAWEVKVSGSLSPADVAEITQVVQHDALADQKALSLSDRLTYGANRLKAKIQGQTTYGQFLIEISVRPDGVVEAAAEFWCGHQCSSRTEYEVGRGAKGWEITRSLGGWIKVA